MFFKNLRVDGMLSFVGDVATSLAATLLTWLFLRNDWESAAEWS